MMSKFAADSAPLLPLAFCFIGGILLTPFVPASLPLWPVLAGTLLFTFLLRRHPTAQSVAVGCCFVVLGLVLTDRHRQSLVVNWPSDPVTAEAVIVSEVTEKPKTMGMDIVLTANGQRLKCYIMKDARSRALSIGDGLRFTAPIQPNPDYRIGTFDYRRYLEVHGFTGQVFVRASQWESRRVSLQGLSCLQRTRLFFLQLRHRLLQRFLHSGIGDSQLAIVSAMTLGSKSALTPAQKELYSQSGASHVLALSGLHLGIIYSLLTLFTFGRRRFLAQLFTLLCIWAYVFLVGMPSSVVRAAVMVTVYGMLTMGHRNRMSVNTLAFTALVMLGLNPYALYDVGFQLSYLAVLSILMWMPLTVNMVSSQWLMRHRLMRWLWGLFAVSVAAQLGVAPLIAYYFGRFPVYFLLTNLVAIPATIAIIYLAAGTLLIPWLATCLSPTVDFLNAALTAIVSLPGSSIEGIVLSPLQVILFYVAILCLYGIARRCSSRPPAQCC